MRKIYCVPQNHRFKIERETGDNKTISIQRYLVTAYNKINTNLDYFVEHCLHFVEQHGHLKRKRRNELSIADFQTKFTHWKHEH